MGRKNIIEAHEMFSTASISASNTSDVVYIKNQDKASILVSWSGSSPSGTLAVQVRNRREPTGAASAWTTLDMGASISISGNTGSHTLIFNELPFSELRLVYTRASGTGTISAILVAKQVGA